MTESEKVKMVALILRRNFSLMTDKMAVIIAQKILDALDEPVTKVTNGPE